MITTISDRIRGRIGIRRSLSVVDRVIPFDDHERYVAVGDPRLCSDGVRWCDFPIRLLDLKSLRSTKQWNRPDNMWTRITTSLRRLSVLDLGVITLTNPCQVIESLAFDLLAGQGTKQVERLRMAKNTPAPGWGITQKAFNKYGTAEIAQDAFPWVPDACRRSNRGMRDASLEGTLVSIGRTAGRPIRWPLASVFLSCVLFFFYASSTIMYLGIYSMARFERQKDRHTLLSELPMEISLELYNSLEADLNADDHPIADGFRHFVGVCIISFLLWSVFNFLVGVVWIESQRPKVLEIVESECQIQNAIWHARKEDEGYGTVCRKLYVITGQVRHERESASSGRHIATAKLFHCSIFEGSIIAKVISTLKRLMNCNTDYCVRYVEYSDDYQHRFTRTRDTIDPVSLDQQAEPGSPGYIHLKKEEEDTDDFNSDDVNERNLPVVMLPPVHSAITQFAMFGPFKRMFDHA